MRHEQPKSVLVLSSAVLFYLRSSVASLQYLFFFNYSGRCVLVHPVVTDYGPNYQLVPIGVQKLPHPFRRPQFYP